MATKTEPKKAVETAVFYAKGHNLLLIRIPEVLRVDSGTGLQQITQHSVQYFFGQDGDAGIGQLEIRSNQDILPTGPPDDEGNPTKESALDWFRRHRNLNVLFWEDGHEPDAAQPTERAQIDAILDAVGNLDADAVELVLAGERATHNRDGVFHAGERALEKIAEVHTALAAQEAEDKKDAAPILPDG